MAKAQEAVVATDRDGEGTRDCCCYGSMAEAPEAAAATDAKETTMAEEQEDADTKRIR